MMSVSLVFLFVCYVVKSQISFSDNEFRPFMPTFIANAMTGVWDSKMFVIGGQKLEGITPGFNEEVYTLDLSNINIDVQRKLSFNFNNTPSWDTVGDKTAGQVNLQNSVQTSVQIGSRLYATYFVDYTINDPQAPAFTGSNVMAIYDMSIPGWIAKDVLMPDLGNFSSPSPDSRFGAASCTMTDGINVYIVGGDDFALNDNSGGNTNTFMYDVSAGMWVNGPVLNVPRWNAGCTFDRDGVNAYIFGGSGPTRDTVLNSIEKLTGKVGGQWDTLTAILGTPRSHSPCIVDRYSSQTDGPLIPFIYCVGGRTGAPRMIIQSVEVFNPINDTILVGQQGSLSFPVYKHSLVQYGPIQTTLNVLFLVGGQNVPGTTENFDKIYYLPVGYETTLSPTVNSANSIDPTITPSSTPSQQPSITPSLSPNSQTDTPTDNTIAPSKVTNIPTKLTDTPSKITTPPTAVPSKATDTPSAFPSKSPLRAGIDPTQAPTVKPTDMPTITPTMVPSKSTSAPIPTIIGASPSSSPTTSEIIPTKSDPKSGNALKPWFWVVIGIIIALILCLILFVILCIICKRDKETNEINKETNELQKVKTVSAGDGDRTTTIPSPSNDDDNEVKQKIRDNDSDSDTQSQVSDDELNAKYGNKAASNNTNPSNNNNKPINNKYADNDSESSSY